MGNGMSPKDPLFWMHHCFVDKLWADYQSITSDRLTPKNLNDDLIPISLLNKKVNDVINIKNISDCAYVYEELFVLPMAPGTNTGTAFV